VIPLAPPVGQILVDLVRAGDGASDEKTSGAGGTTTAVATPAPARRPDARSPRAGTPAPQDVGELLRRAELSHGMSASPSRDEGSGGAGIASGNGNAAGGAGRLGLKDFIRAQIERRWQFDGAGDREIVVTIRLRLSPDGVVQSAQIVDDRTTDPGFHAAAIGARNAALLSSPLQLPPGLFVAGDITVDLNTKDALR
jgi:hypothetical protein